MRLKSFFFFTVSMLAVPMVAVPTVLGSAVAGDPAPVEFGTDPGLAHPKYAFDENAVDSEASQKEAIITQKAQADEITRAQVLAAAGDPKSAGDAKSNEAKPDSGQFDYGYASNEMELAQDAAASGAPTVLLADKDVAPVSAKPALAEREDDRKIIEAVTAAEPDATPYRKDPLYALSSEQEPTPKVETVAYRPAYSGLITNVEPGETVYAIARKYGVSPQDIIALNGLPAPYILKIGQELRIPAPSQGAIIAADRPAVMAEPKRIDQPQAARSVEYKPTEISQPTPIQNRPLIYTIKPGDTLYSLSRRSGIALEQIAAANNITAPYTLSIGQQLIIPARTMAEVSAAPIASGSISTPSSASSSTASTTRAPIDANRNTYIDPNDQWAPRREIEAKKEIPESAPKPVAYPKADLDDKKIGPSRFSWPVQGQVVMNFGLDAEGRRNDGINIAAPVGAPVRSVADGEVVYRGSDLDGYGNLLLIKHADGWVSAYAHNDAMLVRKGEKVSQGQIIAKVGTSGAVAQPQLHFELRHDLKPTDPLAALEGRDALALEKVSVSP